MPDLINFLTSLVKKPLKQADGSVSLLRGDGYGSQFVKSVVPTKHVLAEEGSYFTAVNATPGTGIQAAALITSFTDTNSMFLLQNMSQPGPQGRWIYPDFLRLFVQANPTTTATVIRLIIRIWPAGINPYVVGTPGTLLTPFPVNGSPGGFPVDSSVAKVIAYANGNAFTTLSSTGQQVRTIDNPVISTGAMIVNDSYTLQFGAADINSRPGAAGARSLDVAATVNHTAPVAVGPGETLQIQSWSPSGTTAPSFEYALGWWEQ